MRSDPSTLTTVSVGFIHPGTVHHGFFDSMLNLMISQPPGVQIRLIHSASSAYIPDARCQVVKQFLESDSSEWLWFLDYDISFDNEVLPKLLSFAHRQIRPIVAGVYLAKFGGAWRPCWCPLDAPALSDLEVAEGGPDKLWPLMACGMGCCLIHRSVLEKMGEMYADDPWPWFGHDIVIKGDIEKDGQEIHERSGEDVTFGLRAAKALDMSPAIWGVPVPVTHTKSFNLKPSRVWADPFDKAAFMAVRDGALQKEVELASLLRYLSKDPPERFCEIGTAGGHTFRALCNAATKDALAVSIDIAGFPMQSHASTMVAGAEQRGVQIVGDSGDQNCVEALKEVLGDAKLDFLFIDGDHQYEAVRRDFEIYKGLVREGGKIAFHDIEVHPIAAGCDVSKFWEEVRGDYDYVEFRSPPHDWGGIGVMEIAL